MNRSIKGLATVGLLGVTACAAAVIIAHAGIPGLQSCSSKCSDPNNFLLAQIRSYETEEAFITQVMSPLRMADRKGDGLDEGDIDLLRKRSQAQRRAQRYASVLSYDLDSDLKVTRSEIEDSTPHYGYAQGASNGQADRLMAQYDLNHDGFIDLREIGAAPEQNNFASNDYQTNRTEQLLKLGRGGRLTAPELQRIAQHVFDSVDLNHDGTISADEYQTLRQRIGPAAY